MERGGATSYSAMDGSSVKKAKRGTLPKVKHHSKSRKKTTKDESMEIGSHSLQVSKDRGNKVIQSNKKLL